MNQLQTILEQNKLPQTKSEAIKAQFSNFFRQVAEWETRLSTLSVTSIEQKAEMKMADEARKFLKNKRVEIEKTRKTLKEDALREGQTIDAIAKFLTSLIVPLEEQAEEMAKFAEREAARVKQERLNERMNKLMPFGIAVNSQLIADMDGNTFDSFLSGVIQKHQEQKEAEAKAEAERIERERLEAEERERVRIENEKLKKQLAEQQAKAKAEQEAREKIESELKAKAKAEQEAREKIESELKAKAEAERKAKNAPDRDKIIAFVGKISNIERPELLGEDAKKLMEQVEGLITKINSFVFEKIEKM